MKNENLPDAGLLKNLIALQREEVTEALVYERIAGFVKDEENKKTITKIAAQERTHAKIWASYTHQEVKPYKFRMWFYIAIVRILGLTFGIKLMERNERSASINYAELSKIIPEARKIQEDEEEHEVQLINLIKDKSIDYLGSIVLGLNDALVELVGILAGLTFGLQNSQMIASVGIITGVAAALSMAGSEYLSIKTDGGGTVKPITASIYTGIAYIVTVVILILPYLLIGNVYIALAVTIAAAVAIIALFNYYAAIAKDYSFKSRFWEMIAISMGVAFVSFIIGVVVKQVFNIDV